MAVVFAREHWKSRGGSFSGVTNNQVRREWIVKTSDRNDTPITIAKYFATTLSISYLSLHPDVTLYTFTAREMEIDPLEDTPFAYNVVVTYSSEPIQDEEQDQQDVSPLDRAPHIDLSSELAQTFTVTDKDDEAMLNSANDPYEAIEKDDVRWLFTVRKNLSAIPSWVLDYVNKTNESAFTILGLSCPPRTLKLNGLQIPAKQNENGVTFYPVTAEFAYRRETWDAVRVDEGFNWITGGEKKVIMLDDEDGNKVTATEPQLLDGQGGILLVTLEEAHFNTFEIYESADYSALAAIFS